MSVPAGLGDIVRTDANGDPCDQLFNTLLDQLLVEPVAGEYDLQFGSPCIYAGDPNSPRNPDGTIADVGAFDFDQGILDRLNADGCVNLNDLAALLGEYGCTASCGADLDGGGDTDLADLAALMGSMALVAERH